MPVEAKEQCSPEFRKTYQSIIGSLLYIMLGTRPDITYVVTKLAQFAANPSKEHMTKAQYICHYLNSTPTIFWYMMALEMRESLPLWILTGLPTQLKMVYYWLLFQVCWWNIFMAILNTKNCCLVIH